MKMKGIIFDLDGTLWNTTSTIVPVWNRVLKNHKEIDRQITENEMYSYMGKTLDEIALLVFPNLPLEKSRPILDECCSTESAHLEQVGGVLYPKLEETLARLVEDYSLYIVSNCQNGYLQAFLNYHRLNKYFSDFEMSGRTNKSKGENIRLIIERNGIEKAVYVGDTVMDKEASDQAGIPFIFAEYGFGNVCDPPYSIKQFSEIINVADRIFHSK
ncbi:MAG: HAD family hydrolase [Ruminococcus sp.]